MWNGIPLASDLADLGEGLNRADLVVGIHHGDEHSVLGEGPAHVIRIHQALTVNRQIGHPVAERVGQLVAGVPDRVVLDRRGDDLSPWPTAGQGGAAERKVVALCATPGKDDLGWPGTEDLGHGSACRVEGLPSSAAVPVDTRWISPSVGKVRKHRLHNPRVDGSGRSVIQIDKAGLVCHASPISVWHTPVGSVRQSSAPGVLPHGL